MRRDDDTIFPAYSCTAVVCQFRTAWIATVVQPDTKTDNVKAGVALTVDDTTKSTDCSRWPRWSRWYLCNLLEPRVEGSNPSVGELFLQKNILVLLSAPIADLALIREYAVRQQSTALLSRGIEGKHSGRGG